MYSCPQHRPIVISVLEKNEIWLAIHLFSSSFRANSFIAHEYHMYEV